MKAIDRFYEYLAEKSLKPTNVEKEIGLSNGYLSVQKKRNADMGEGMMLKVIDYFQDINPMWLLTGEGNMLKDKNSSLTDLVRTDPTKNINYIPPTAPIGNISDEPEAIPFAEAARSGLNPIPLVTQRAAAGFGNADFSIAEDDVKEYYVIPKFKYCHVDFMIEVSGLSMYPHFNSGDVIACSILRNTGFIQWNKCHVIATREQGILIKRLMPGEDKKHLRAISDNKEYPPFEIPVDEITGIAIVVGSVGLE